MSIPWVIAHKTAFRLFADMSDVAFLLLLPVVLLFIFWMTLKIPTQLITETFSSLVASCFLTGIATGAP